MGDLHVKKSNLEKQELLFQMLEDSLNQHIILTGDLLDTKAIVRSECFNFLYDKFRTSKKTFHIVVGNHDQHNLGTLENSLRPLGALPNVNIYGETTEFKIFNIDFVGIPYIHDPEQFKKEIKKIKNPSKKFLICHQGLTGFDYGNGYIAKDETDSNSIKGFKEVIIGHFHKYQEFSNGCFIGTPFSQTFGESNQEKYIIEIEEDGLVVTKTTNFPMHMTYEIDCDCDSEKPNYDENNYNRIILTGSKESIEEFSKVKEMYPGAKILKRPKPEKLNNNVEISEGLSNAKKFEVWASDVGELEEELVELGLAILEDVAC